MLSYKEYEKAVFDWLIAKNKNTGFTFGLRRVASKGAETDYFIGKEASSYFGTTFWSIPVSFPGSSGDLIQLNFQYTSNKRELVYFFEFNQTKDPNSPQNQYALELIQSLHEPIEKKFGLRRLFNPQAKMYNFQVKPIEPAYGTIDFMLGDVDTQLNEIIQMVNDYIKIIKNKYTEFKADQITSEDFKSNLEKTYKRIEKHSSVATKVNNDERTYSISRELYDIIHLDITKSKFYFSGLDKIISAINLQLNDNRVYFNYRKGKLIFGVGQRYVWCINNKKSSLRYISKVPNEVSSEKFENGKEAYLNYGHDFSNSEIANLTIEPILETLDTTSLSGFLRYNKSDFENMVFNKEYRQAVFDNKNITINDQDSDSYPNDREPLNQILYGPPGTGKTYHTINKAVAIANPLFDLGQSRDIVKVEYKRLVDTGQIVFTTFHQSMSYEDFVEGIKPIIDEDEDGNKQVVYEVQKGILKNIVDAAKKEKDTDNTDRPYTFDDAWNELIQFSNREIENDKNLFLPIQTKNLGLHVVGISAKGNLVLKPIYKTERKTHRSLACGM